MSKRLAGRFGYPADDPFRVTLHEDKLNEPLSWKKPRTVFCVSMGDLFHEDVPAAYILRVWQTMYLAKDHTFLVLTKRPQRMERILNEWMPSAWALSFLRLCPGTLPNVWLGVTAENQARADERIPLLLKCPAAVRYVSYEPALSAVSFHPFIMHQRDRAPGETGHISDYGPALDWIICGAETGPGARPMDPDWARGVRDQCKSAGVPFFMKAMSKRAPVPSDLDVHEWPHAALDLAKETQ